MIECPICHVMNEDGSHFCAECGQRFSPGGLQPPALGSVPPPYPGSAPVNPQGNLPGNQPANPGFNPQNNPLPNVPMTQPDNQWNQMNNPPNPPEQPKKRLHSPIFGSGYDDEPEPEPDMRGRAPAKRGQNEDTGKHKGLRSPLLGGSDEEENFDNEPRRGAPGRAPGRSNTKGSLRSPLLGGADDDDNYDDPPQPQGRGGGGSGAFPHRSNREVQNEEPHERPSGARGLRSPLLGGGDDDAEDFSQLRRTNKPSNVPNERRANPGAWDPGSASGKPQRLRSKLLGGGDVDDYEDYDDEDEEISDPKALRSPLLRAVTSPHETVPAPHNQQQPHQAPSQQAPAQGGYPPAGGGGFAQPSPEPTYQPQPDPNQQFRQPPAPPLPTMAAGAAQAASPFSRNTEPAPLPPLPRSAGINDMPTTVKPSRYKSEDREPEVTRPSFDRLSPDSQPSSGGGGSVSPAIAGLGVFALILKIWYLVSYTNMWNQAPFMADQLGQILVMVALILVTLGVSKR